MYRYLNSIVINPDGSTTEEWIERETEWPAPPPLPLDEQWGLVRSKRNTLLAESDWSVLPDVPMPDETRALWVEYRQGLRDVTSQPDPYNIAWPVKPS